MAGIAWSSLRQKGRPSYNLCHALGKAKVAYNLSNRGSWNHSAQLGATGASLVVGLLYFAGSCRAVPARWSDRFRDSLGSPGGSASIGML